MRPLPIDLVLPAVLEALGSSSRLILCAAPGAGKTTRVPAALLDAGLAGTRQVVVLEPRRIAARAAAEYVAQERHSRVGGEVGYRVRFEQQGGPHTRLWFLTEGVLGRQLVRDPFLEDVGVLVLDEFHERHLQGDVALAVARELQETVRPDLKLVIMSATLETDRLAAALGGCPVVTSSGRAYPVQIEHATHDDDRPLAGQVVTALRGILGAADDGGDVLVFLPGAAEIRRAGEALAPLAAAHDLAVLALHGDLPLDAQARALRRGAQRKVVLSTNVAETALTVEGVTVVIDSGLARIARLDARHGLNVVRVMPISRAAADQRAGRAGRTAPGRCLRLWTRADHDGRRAHETPEVMRLELSATLLELRAWGIRDMQGFGWLDPPPPAAVQHAEQLLALLGAVDARSGNVTDIGRRILALSVAPRLARMLVEAESLGCAVPGALLAALAAERDICLTQRTQLMGSRAVEERWPAGPSDLLLRMELFQEAAHRHFDHAACRDLGLDSRTVHTVQRTHTQLLRALGIHRDARPQRGATPADDDKLLRCTLAGFADRLVRRRAPTSQRGVMVGGKGVVLAADSCVRDAELFVALEIDAGPQRQLSEARVRLASAVRAAWLDDMFPDAVESRDELIFDAERERVVTRRRVLFHDLVLSETVITKVDAERAGAVLAETARHAPTSVVALGRAEDALLTRIRFLAQWMPELRFPSDTNTFLADAVATLCIGQCSFAAVRQADLLGTLRHMLDAPQRRAIERDAPVDFQLPSGRRVAVAYEAGKPPSVAARIQELFGLTATPRLAAGRVPLAIEILGPNYRPVQITDDLESFWRRTYPEIRKQLRGRYPKHPWPEDPFAAVPTAKTGRAAIAAARKP